MVSKQTQILKFTNSGRQSLEFRSLMTCSLQSISIASVPTLDVVSLNKMINGFSKAGDLSSAQRLFDEMPERDLVSWNSIMAAYARNNCCHQVLQIFSELHTSRWKPNRTSLSTVLSSCAKLRALDQGKQVHGMSIKTHSSANVFVGTSLITMYSRCGVSDCLVRVFDSIDSQNVASWNALISGFMVNRRIGDAREVFDRMPGRNVVSWTAMINGYIEVKKVRTALELFNVMPVKNLVSWSVMLGGFVCNGQYEEAIDFFTRMISSGVQATVISTTKVISACSRIKNPTQGRMFHGYVVKLGFQQDQIIEASLVLMYCECLDIEEAMLEFDKMECKFIASYNCLICGYISSDKINEARELFDKMAERDHITWNSMISGYLRGKRIDDAIGLFSRMPEPTMETITSLMSSFIEIGKLDEAQKLFDLMLQRDVIACTTMIFGYVEGGLLDNAMELFNKMAERNVVTYNVMISGLLRHGRVKEAFKLFNESPELDNTSWEALVSGFIQNRLYDDAFLLYKKMLLSDITPSELIIANLLKASATLSLLIHGEQIHVAAIKLGHGSCLVVGNSLINMYSKCGNMLSAESVFEQMPESDVVTWNAMICGYAFSGFGKKALDTLESMKIAMIKPDDITFLGILSACCHMCLLEEAQHYFNSMRCDYGIIPGLNHYACIIDLLCRMGMVEKAERLVYSMPFEPDPVIWTSLLSGCRLNCDIKLAEHAANQLSAWDLRDSIPYLHLVGIYGSAGRWDDMENMKSHMIELGSNKQPGWSWI